MQEDIFRTLQESYRKGVFNVPTTFYFAIGESRNFGWSAEIPDPR